MISETTSIRPPLEILGFDGTSTLVWLRTQRPCSGCAVPTALGVIVFDYHAGNSLYCWTCLVERGK